MYTTYHLNSAEEVNSDLLDSIKATFKSITIVVEEDDLELTPEMKEILDERLKENEKDYVSSEESIRQLNQKYGL
jgi:hypothetical protein